MQPLTNPDWCVTITSMKIECPWICSATQRQHKEDTSLYKSLENLGIECSKLFITENFNPLSTVYNKLLKFARQEDEVDCVVFIHDDVTLMENPIPKLEKLFDTYDVVGVAGASKIELKSPALWHLMGGNNLHGEVYHALNGQIHPTNFGPYPHSVVMIDGVFMALNTKAIRESSFDEENPSKWHMYDLNFSLDCVMKKLKIGVGDIAIIHESPGLRSFTDDWIEGEKYFLNKYNK